MKCLSLTIFLWIISIASLIAQTSNPNRISTPKENYVTTSINTTPTGTQFFSGTLPTISFTTTNISCNGLTDGCATAVVSGGTGNTHYLWSNGSTSSNICGLGVGNYTVTITDTIIGGGGPQVCVVVNDTTITQPFSLATSIDTVANVICAGNNNGFIDISVSGGTAPYQYNWSNGDTTQDINTLTDSIYSVIITDANGCITHDTATVETLGFLEVVVDSAINIACHGDSTGAIYTTATGDTSFSGCTSSVVALNEIMYRPVNNNGVNPNTGEYIELIGPAGTDISCYVLTDGDWTITIPPGTSIPADGFFTIGNDVVWGGGTFDLDAENCNCFTDGSGGSGLLILTDGGEYVALYDGAGTFLQGVIYGSPSAGNTPSGTVISTIGTASCPSFVSIPNAPAFETAPAGFANGTSIIRNPDGSGAWGPQVGGSLNTCNSIGNGSTGSGNVTYLWSNGDTTQDISGLSAGVYTVTTTNSYGCTATTTYTITEPALLVGTSTATGVVCVGDTTGEIDLLVTGGTSPYQYNWSTGATTQDLDSLSSGIYCVTITDSNSCTAIVCDTFEEVFFNIPVDSFATCSGTSIPLTVNTNATTINWTPSSTLNNDTIANPTATPTTSTTYVVTASVGGNCVMTDSIVITVADLDVSLATLTPVLCHGDTTGGVTTSITGTGSNFDYLWNTGDTTTSLTNVAAGTYRLTVSLAGFCEDTLTVVIPEPDSVLSLNVSNTTDVTCFGDSTGAASILASGGTTPYTYSWSNTATTPNVNNLTSGLYIVTVTDSNSCTEILTVSISEPSAISISYNATNVSCNGTNDGTATVIPTGGTAGYTYLWDVTAGSQTTPTAIGLASSTYSVTVTDTVGCTGIANGIFVNSGVPVDSNDVPLVVLTGILDCDLNPTGSLGINTANTYTYLWSNGATDQTVTGLPAGAYTVTVTNGLGCSYVQSANIVSPLVPTVNPFINAVGMVSATVVSGATVTISGGNDQSFQGVAYNWTANSSDVTFGNAANHATTALSNVTGVYTLTLTATASDSSACQDTGSVVLNVESIYNGMPTAFTPNGDNINDTYRPTGLTADDVITFRVYNRWGQEIYNGDDLENNGWDGRYKGIEQPTEVYLFLLEYKVGVNGTPKVRKGEFTLIR
ncbi:T9SS type B sorting domain-containing protein [Aureispira anguillae]|nr:T9SS type B sorting domain-containing protein [Aureispira anguillae]